MKKIILIFSLFLCSCEPSGSLLRVEVEGLKKGTLYLHRYDSLWKSHIVDSATANGKGVFEFRPKVQAPELFTLRLHNGGKQQPTLAFFMEEKGVDIYTYNEAFELKASVKGSSSQELFEQYQSVIRRFGLQNTELIAQQLVAQKQGLPTDSIAKAMDKNTLRMYLYLINFALTNAHSPVAAYVTLQEVEQLQPKYLDTIYRQLSPEVKAHPYGKMLSKALNKPQL